MMTVCQRLLLMAAMSAVIPLVGVAQAPPAMPMPSEAEIRSILVQRVDAQRQSVGIVVGVIEPTGRRIVAYGHPAKDVA